MILVTGATGFLGSFICRQLLKEERPFIALKRSTSDLSLLEDVQDKIQWHEGDVIDAETLKPVMAQVDTVIHSAAIVSFHSPDRSMMEAVNVGGTKNLVDLCLQHDIKKLIHISSVAALGRTKAHGEIDETNKWQHSKWNTNYGETKYLAELEVWRGHVEGLNAVILNPSVILGPGDWTKSSSALFKYVWDERKFYTDGLVNYVDVRDVVSIIIKLLDTTENYGERYIVNGGNVSFKQLFDAIAQRFNKKPPSIKANSSWLLNMGIFMEWFRSKVSGHRPMVTRETARVSKNQIYFNNAKVVNKLNHTFAPLDETLDWVCSHYVQNKN